MSAYVGVNGTAKRIISGYVGIDGVARKVIKGYVGDNDGIARLIWSGTGIVNPFPDFLQDFEGYISGTEQNTIYNLVRWKGTLNGEPSTEIVIPDRTDIVL